MSWEPDERPGTLRRRDRPRAARAIEVDGVSVSYRVRIDSQSMLTDLRRLVSGRSRHDRTVPALQDVSFTVPRGTVLGVIGRNGAGKSTLLRVIAGILAPDRGRVVVRGRISTLLSVGVGFDANLTGRENIKLGGLAVGLSARRLAELTDSIAEFAQLDEYLDYPLRTYSAGMKSRLGFALAAHLDPEVLLIDEALSGGDTAFGQPREGEDGRALPTGPYHRAGDARADHGAFDGERSPLAPPGKGRSARRSRRRLRTLHAVLPDRAERMVRAFRRRALSEGTAREGVRCG